MLRKVLRGMASEVIEAGDVAGGIALVQSEAPDLVLCDLQLGDGTGWDVLAAIRAEPRTATISVILMTGHEGPLAMRQGMELGADDFLIKPFSEPVLRAAVRARLSHQTVMRAESERTNALLRQMLEISGDLMALADPDSFDIAFLNRAARALTGLNPASERVALSQAFTPTAWEELRAQGIPGAMRDGVWRGESQWRRAGGGEARVYQEVFAHRADDGQIDGISLIARDLTEREQAADRLRTLMRAIEQNPVSIVITDPNGRIEYVNPCFERVTGYTAAEAMGETPQILMSSLHTEDFYKQLWSTILAGEEWRGELHNRGKDGRDFWEQASISPVRDANGRVTHFIAVKQDITERKLAEMARTRMELQLRQAQKLQAIGHLAAGIAHEINTPVQFIGDNTRFLGEMFGGLEVFFSECRRLITASRSAQATEALAAECEMAWQSSEVDYLRAEVPAALGQMVEGVERIRKIVRAMKDFSHPESENKSLVDLNRLVESTLIVSRNEWKYVAELSTDFDPSLTAVPCLPGEFNQVILNLVVNAAHAMADAQAQGRPSPGALTVTTRRCPPWAEVRVADTGTGIPESARPHVFEPFFTTKEVGRGTGQGLALAHAAIVGRHGGMLHFETETGRGTTFVVRLPLAEDPEASGRPGQDGVPAQTTTSGGTP